MSTPDEEIHRLKNEVHSKEEMLNQLKLKTKAFVDNMRTELSVEKKKVADLEEQLKHATTSAAVVAAAAGAGAVTTTTTTTPATGGISTEEVEHLKKELAAVTHRENDLKVRAKTFADTMKQQLAVEKEKVQKLENELQAKDASNSSHSQQDSMIAHADAKHAAELASLRTKYEDQLNSLKNELSRVQTITNTQSQEHQHLQEVLHQLEQHHIEIEHLQKQVQDKDFQLEQHAIDRRRADENEHQVQQLSGELNQIKCQLQNALANVTQAEEKALHCDSCTRLQQDLDEISRLYEKANFSRSQSDTQLAEMTASLNQKDSEICILQGKIQTFEQEKQSLQQEMMTLNHKISFHSQDQAQRQQEFEKKNQELAILMENLTKDFNEKRQKAKQVVLGLTNEKNTLQENKNELQKEVERLRMELNQKHLDHEKKIKHLQEETTQKMNQNVLINQKLQEENGNLQKTVLALQESDRSQQRARELANAKKEVEDSNKKRLAAKAETQKLAADLENVQKHLTQMTEHTSTNCLNSAKTMANLQEKITETLQILEKKAEQKRKRQGKNMSPSEKAGLLHGSSMNNEMDDVHVRGAEFVDSSCSSPRQVMSPASGVKRVEENITRVNERLAVLVEVTEKLCDLSVEQNEVNLKDVLIERVSAVFGQCLPERIRPSYAQVEDAMEGFETLKPSCSSLKA